MTWEELVTLFISYQQPVHVIRGDGLDAVSLQLTPATWFISIKSSGRLNIGVYKRDALRLVGTHSVPLAEWEPSFCGVKLRRLWESKSSLCSIPKL